MFAQTSRFLLLVRSRQSFDALHSPCHIFSQRPKYGMLSVIMIRIKYRENQLMAFSSHSREELLAAY